MAFRQQQGHVFERSFSLNRPPPHRGHVPLHLDLEKSKSQSTAALIESNNMSASPYMEPSPSNQRRQNNMLLSHDVLPSPYMEPSPTVPRKFSEQVHSNNSMGASPYMTPSSNMDSKQKETRDRFISQSSVDTVGSSNFVYIPPEV